MDREVDITGNVYGHLTVLEYDHSCKHKAYFKCQCDCGKVAYVSRYNLTSGKTQSCGHLRKDSTRIKRGQYHKVELTEAQKNWLLKHYCHTKNDEIKNKLGITDGYLHRFARAHGLVKTSRFMKKCQAETTAKAKESHIRNKTYPPKGYRIPGSELYGFKPGVTPEMRLGKKRNRQRIEKAAQGRAKTLKMEKALVLFGLAQQTRLRVIRQPRKTTCRRCYLKKHGYIINRGGYEAFYDETTSRCFAIEQAKSQFRFMPVGEIKMIQE